VEMEDVFREHQRALYAFFVRTVGDRHDAEELTQETFVRACGAALRFRGDSSVRIWLFGIARRVLMEASRKGLFERRRVPELAEVPDVETDHALRLDLEREFTQLALADRETLMLVDFLGFSPAEAAGVVGADVHTFRMRLHRARRRLRTRLEVLVDG
jgi:RNA polymerase sigma-70 factor (ECF subfamily)